MDLKQKKPHSTYIRENNKFYGKLRLRRAEIMAVCFQGDY